jgi:23S rRNA (uridine2552-2'-O)-methyltransferase
MSNFITRDYYFEKAKAQGFKARSVFKLQEIDQALKIIKSDSVILDLGCSPGSWLQYIATKIGPKGRALGVDLTPITETFHPNIKTHTGDCFELSDDLLKTYLGEQLSFDLILSDMAPKTTGIKHVDQIRSLVLAEQAFELALIYLKTAGHVVIKIFNSAEVSQLINIMKKEFKVVKQVRPKSIRTVSKEFYIVGLHKK